MRKIYALPILAAVVFSGQSFAIAADPESPSPTGSLAPAKVRLSNEMPTKGSIEFPLKLMLKNKTGGISPLIPTSRSTSSIPSNKEITHNADHVQAGLVAWSPDFATACQKSKSSGKAVLLFQMMGKLDEEFC